jgi:hypothetical protein
MMVQHAFRLEASLLHLPSWFRPDSWFRQQTCSKPECQAFRRRRGLAQLPFNCLPGSSEAVIISE